jgi:hypothetical protein
MPKGAALGGETASGCPGGAPKVRTLVRMDNGRDAYQMVCPGAGGAASGGGGGGFTIPGMNVGTGAGTATGTSTWSPSAVARPNLTPIDPQAGYDPEIANQLARQRANTADLKAGTGFAEDVAVGSERDQLAAQMQEAEQGAAQAGIPFDKARFLMEAQRGQASRRAQSTLNREQQVGAAIGAESGVAQGQAGERTDRLAIDLKRDTTENELALDRYGRDIQKYGIDAQAATAANGSLMDFYSRLMSGAFSSIGGSNFSSRTSYA